MRVGERAVLLGAELPVYMQKCRYMYPVKGDRKETKMPALVPLRQAFNSWRRSPPIRSDYPK
jgi:hypothetical protein